MIRPLACARRAFDALLPPLCLHCDAPLDEPRPGWCAACGVELIPPGPGCTRCALPGPVRDSCARCRDWPRGLRAVAAVRHVGPARTVVHALKYRGWRHLAEGCAERMAGALAGEGRIPEAIAPVPLHPRRRRERGYDQAAMLAEALARRLDRPRIAPLVRTRATPPQVGRDRAGRMANVRRAFATRPGRVPRAPVALVDDVATSGATLAAAARPLLEAGATAVEGVTFSLAPRPDSF